MKIHVEFTNDEHTKARILIVPSWLARLFGARPRAGDAKRVDAYSDVKWVWVTTLRDVDQEFGGRPVLHAIELQEVTPLPRAQISGAISMNAKAGGSIVAISGGKERR